MEKVEIINELYAVKLELIKENQLIPLSLSKLLAKLDEEYKMEEYNE